MSSDKEYMRDLMAMFVSIRIGMDGSKEMMAASAKRCYQFADEMMKAREENEEVPDNGIAAVIPKRKRSRSDS